MKKALIVGINYESTGSELHGCINDAASVFDYLIEKGYQRGDIYLMTDHTELKPTRANILKEFLSLITSGSSTLYFHYSGHGGSVRDLDGDEQDGNDETLIPIDYLTNGYILDDEMRGVLTCLKQNQSLTCVLDCCHSGTGLDLKYNLYEKCASKIMQMKDDGGKETRGQCIMLSGCEDRDYSADSVFPDPSSSSGYKYQGAMTYAFLESIDCSNTYEELIKNIRRILKEKNYSQVPNLSSGKYLDLRAKIKV